MDEDAGESGGLEKKVERREAEGHRSKDWIAQRPVSVEAAPTMVENKMSGGTGKEEPIQATSPPGSDNPRIIGPLGFHSFCAFSFYSFLATEK